MIIFTVVGARPQFVKAAAVSRVLRLRHTEILVHTGQHYDPLMSDVFFRELNIPAPDLHLGVGSGTHAEQTGRMLIDLEAALLDSRPDMVLVYGDTNSTLAGALAAAKLNLPVAHVEAGMRSRNRRMPEEINRVLTDHLASLLLCSSPSAAQNLAAEGIVRGVHITGDVMGDLLLEAAARAEGSDIHARLGVTPGAYVLLTVHRVANTDDPARLAGIVAALAVLREQVVFPVHPRTRAALGRAGIDLPANVRATEPLGYLDTVALERSARVIITDSGGVQKEAYWLAVPCVTLREETEWSETVDTGWNILAGADRERIVAAVGSSVRPAAHPQLYGAGEAVARTVVALGACPCDSGLITDAL